MTLNFKSAKLFNLSKISVNLHLIKIKFVGGGNGGGGKQQLKRSSSLTVPVRERKPYFKFRKKK